MKGLSKLALAMLLVAACGRDSAITEPDAPNAPTRPLLPPPTPNGRVVLAIGVDPTTGASIETNKDDYTPGEAVNVVGRGWTAGETVHLSMTEDPDTHADVTMDVQADSAGGFDVVFYGVTPEDLGVTFTLTATGVISNSVAVATFTDGNFSLRSAFTPAGGPTFSGSILKFPQSAVCDANSSGQSTVTGNVTTSAGPSTGVNTGQSAELSVPASVPGYAFSSWSISGAVTIVSGAGTPTMCVAGTAGSDARTFTANYVAAAANTAPVVSAGNDATINEGDTFTQNGSFVDPDADSWAATVDYGDGSGVQSLALVGKNFSLSHLYADNGTYNVTVTVNDGTTTGSDVVVVTVNNVAPIVSAGGDETINEGDTFTRNGSFTDPGADTWNATVDYGDGSGTQALALVGKTFALSHTYADNGVYTVTVTVTDDDSGVGTDGVQVTVLNVAPVIGTITAPLAPVAVGTNNVTVSWDFDDPGADSWTCSIEWDTGAGFTSFPSVAKTCSATTTLTPGLYTVTVKVTDDDGGEDSETLTTYIVVYDPNGGFVTGGGWIMSPLNAWIDDLTLTGKATFGFVSKYEKNKTLPQGNTEFQFHAASLEFKSTSYEWLVVAGTRAQYKGDGMLNGVAGYGFLLTAIDGGNTSGGVNPDKFRIKIVHKASGTVVYDNQRTAIEDSDAATGLSGGSIVIHTKK